MISHEVNIEPNPSKSSWEPKKVQEGQETSSIVRWRREQKTMSPSESEEQVDTK